ncbi:hypothetical protein D3C85_1894210 [compost metagenome]
MNGIAPIAFGSVQGMIRFGQQLLQGEVLAEGLHDSEACGYMDRFGNRREGAALNILADRFR